MKDCLELSTWTSAQKSLAFVGLLNLVFVLLQLFVAVHSNSLAMLSDAFHNLSDVAAAYVAWKCERLRFQQTNRQFPFGYLRFQVLGALVNAICLVSLSAYLILAAVPLLFPDDSSSSAHSEFQPDALFVAVAGVGILINLFSALLLCCPTDSEGNAIAVHAHLGCSCASHGPAAPTQGGGSVEDGELNLLEAGATSANSGAPSSGTSCQDACCTPVTLTPQEIAMPFAFARNNNNRRRQPFLVSDATTDSTSNPIVSGATPAPVVSQPAVAGVISPVAVLPAPVQPGRGMSTDRPPSSLPGATAPTLELAPRAPSVPPAPPAPPASFDVVKKPSSGSGSDEASGEGGGASSDIKAQPRRSANENVRTVALHLLGDAATSVGVFVVGIVVMLYQSSASKSGVSLYYLDPALTLVLAVSMILAVRGVIRKSFHVLLEGSPAGEVALMQASLDGDAALRRAGLRATDLTVTDLDFDGQSRRATVVLRPISGSPLAALSHRAARQRIKSLLANHGVKWAAVEIEDK